MATTERPTATVLVVEDRREVLDVLQRTLSAEASGLHLLVAFGPGFSVSFALLDL